MAQSQGTIMARPINIQVKQLRELQSAMKRGETCIDPEYVKPIIADALLLMKHKAYELLRRLTKRTPELPPKWEHIEDALVVQQGRSTKIATAFCKVFRKTAPHARWIEWGHKIVGHRPLRKFSGRTTTANPFFRTALDMTRVQMRRHIREGLQHLIGKGFGFGE
ncbi:MAG: hypothetical protein LLF89_08505 [Spirochaetaceae bacterium]|nr:hypothetical protein [Spirochaetaceae bacterium]